ncbi:hypothetical protein FH972_021298 [Carpinus fangiana]|uniref:Uncharacterized protein n=1 Tax=Carpinus fangiana TaxID=176857 RepID=A0A5N6KP51_9ROSI|nr:hypothetical protein FH972_021298 [Carpinus fangiana]
MVAGACSTPYRKDAVGTRSGNGKLRGVRTDTRLGAPGIGRQDFAIGVWTSGVRLVGAEGNGFSVHRASTGPWVWGGWQHPRPSRHHRGAAVPS